MMEIGGALLLMILWFVFGPIIRHFFNKFNDISEIGRKATEKEAAENQKSNSNQGTDQ